MRHYFTLTAVSFPLLFLGFSARAQTYRHTAVWLRMAASYTISKQWGVVGDLYYRRQSHPDHGLSKPLDSPLLWAGRLGISYRTTHWQYSFLPLVFYHSYPALGNAADLKRAPVPEWRPSVFAEWTLDLPSTSVLRLRAGYEYRLFTMPGIADLGRLRFRAAWRKGLGRDAYGQLSNETLLYAPPNTPASGHLFDQNRTNVAAGYVLSNISTVEVGYQFTHRERRSIVEFDDEHALTVTLYLKVNP